MWREGRENPAQLWVLLPTFPGHRGKHWDLVTLRKAGGLSALSNQGLWVEQPWGRWKPALSTPAMESPLKSHRDTSSNTPGKGFADPGVFPWQGYTQKPRTEVLWQCVNHGKGRLSVARVICARSQDLLNPWGESKFNDWAVLEARLKHPWEIWGGLWENPQRSLSPSSSSLKMKILRKCSFST